MRRRLNSESGMTLMELLAAMVIGTLLITLVVQGLGIALGLYERVTRISAGLDVQVRDALWFEDSLVSLIGCADASHCLTGNSTAFEGYTFAGIHSRPGTRTWIRWELMPGSGDATLVAREGRPEAPATTSLSSLDLPADARFSYQDDEGKWVSRWEHPTVLPGDDVYGRQLPLSMPKAIRIEDSHRTVFGFANLRQRPVGMPDVREEIGF